MLVDKSVPLKLESAVGTEWLRRVCHLRVESSVPDGLLSRCADLALEEARMYMCSIEASGKLLALIGQALSN